MRSVLRMMVIGLSIVTAQGLSAQTAVPEVSMASQSDRIADVLMIDPLLQVLRDEGLANTEDMDRDLLGGSGGAAWAQAVSDIYSPARMRQLFDQGFGAAIADEASAQAGVLGFFDTELGQKILRLELDARRSLLDPDIEAAAGEVWAKAQKDDPERADQLRQLVEANDLIETNVMGALNANLAFYQGLSEGGAFPEPMAESEMLASVWQQEEDMRRDTVDWLYPYLYLAYQPLTDAELAQYIDFARSDAGLRANSALFAGFDSIFVDLSRQLGLSAARLMTGEDI